MNIFTLAVTVNFPDGSERIFPVQHPHGREMTQGELEDAIIDVITENDTASSFVLVVVRSS